MCLRVLGAQPSEEGSDMTYEQTESAALANTGDGPFETPPIIPAYRIIFKDGRIGRTRGNGDIVITARDADDIAAQIFFIARKKLASSWFDVTVDLEEMHGSIEYGRFGEFTIERLEKAETTSPASPDAPRQSKCTSCGRFMTRRPESDCFIAQPDLDYDFDWDGCVEGAGT